MADETKALGSGVEGVTLDFGNALGIPFDGDARQIQQEIDEAVRRATDRVLTDSGAKHYDFSMAMGIADGSAVPIKVTVIPPKRVPIPKEMPIEEAETLVLGYSKCSRLYERFRDANDAARYATLDAVLRNAIRAMLPKASDHSVTAIIEHAKSTNGSYAGTVNACETECRLIARLIADATGEACDIPDKPQTRKPTRKSKPGTQGSTGKPSAATRRQPTRRKGHRVKTSATSAPTQAGGDGLGDGGAVVSSSGTADGDATES